MRNVIINRERINHANAGESEALLILEERNFFRQTKVERMRTSGEEVRFKQRGDILRRHGPESHTALGGFNFDQRLKPEHAARTIADDLDRLAALFGLASNRGGDTVSAHGESGCIARNVNFD